MSFFKNFKKGMTTFGNDISTIVNTVLLFVVYVVGIGVTSIVAKIIGKKFLDMKLSSKKSYWRSLNLKKKSVDDYYRQF